MGRKRRKTEAENESGPEAPSEFSGIPDFIALCMVAGGLFGILFSVLFYGWLGLAGSLMCGLASVAAVVIPFWINSHAGQPTMRSDTGSYAADALIGAVIIKTIASDSEDKDKK